MLDSMPQTQGLMRGGLGAVSGQPPAPPNPQAMAAGSSQQGAMNQIMNELVMPSIQEATRAMKRLQTRIPMYEDELERQNELFYQQLAPRESSWGDVLGGMAAMAAKVQPPPGSLTPDMGQLLASMGAGAAASRQDFENTEREKAQLRQKTAYSNLAESEKRLGDLTTKGMAAARTFGAGKGGSSIELRQLANGQVAVFDRNNPGAGMLGVYGPERVTDLVKLKMQYLDSFSKQGGMSVEEADAASTQMALRALPPQAAPAATPAQAAPAATPKVSVSGLTPQQESQLRGAISAYDADPSEANRKRVDALWQSFGPAIPDGATPTPRAPSAVAAPANAPPQAQNLAERTLIRTPEQMKFAEKSGGIYADVYRDIQNTGQAASTLTGKLNLMEDLTKRHGDAIPEGAAADFVATVKSVGQTFGLKISGTGVTDVMKSLGTEGALQSRTAEGQNLLPGAMSNYENTLLREIFPNIAFTTEGRLLQIQIAKAQLQMKMELADAARNYIQEKGTLDKGWDRVAAEYAKKNPFLDPRRIAALSAYKDRLIQDMGRR